MLYVQDHDWFKVVCAVLKMSHLVKNSSKPSRLEASDAQKSLLNQWNAVD